MSLIGFTPQEDIITFHSKDISNTAKKDIIQLVKREYNVSLPDSWDFALNISIGEYRGKLSKRIAKFVYNVSGVKMANQHREMIGTISRRGTANLDEFVIDFTDDLDSWTSGDFGDNGSCFWGENKAARIAMDENDEFSAIRFYADDMGSKGIARAWIWDGNNCVVVFNGYGMETQQIAVVLTQLLETSLNKPLTMRKISLSNFGSSCDLLYINSGKGFVIGEKSVVDRIDAIDFEFEIYDESISFCEICQTAFNIEWEGGFVGDTCVCTDCLQNETSICDGCQERFLNDDVTTVGDMVYCDHCLQTALQNDEVYLCEDCEEYHLATNDNTFVHAVRNDNGQGDVEIASLCEYCANSYNLCKVCGSLFYAEDVMEICPVCKENGNARCERCDDLVQAVYPIPNATTGQTEYACTDCTMAYYGYIQDRLPNT